MDLQAPCQAINQYKKTIIYHAACYDTLDLQIPVSDDAYRPVKVHVVGDDADVGMEDLVLMDNLL